MSWWFWLSATGAMLAGSVAVKFVGIFVVVLVGFRAIADLWDILGDLSRPVVSDNLNDISFNCFAHLKYRLSELHHQAFPR